MSDEVTGKSLTYLEVDLDVYRATIFENEPIAAGPPLNWTVQWSPVTTISVVSESSMPSGKAVRIQKSAGNDRSSIVWNVASPVRDVSAVGLFRSRATALTNMGIVLRASGGDSTENAYWCRFVGGTGVQILKLAAGSAAGLALENFAHTLLENLWLRFDALNVTGGVLLRAKAWRGEIDDEPEDFVVSFTETTTVLAAGNVGLIATLGDTPDFDVGFFRFRSLFSNTTETVRYVKSVDYAPDSIDAIPSLLEVQISPGAISLGENLGERSSLSAAFRDHKHADLGEMYDRGTYWGKFRARQLFRRGENIRVLRGFLGDALADMEARHYVLDAFDGPTPSGAFQFTGKDPLKLADNDRALAPAPSQGALIANVLAAATSFSLTPGGIGSTYPTSGYVAVGGKEVMAFQRGGNDAFTKAMLHLDGADTSNVFTDTNAGGSAKTWTQQGNAQIDTADFKFSGSSALFDGTGDAIQTPDDADFSLGTSDFTIDCWFKVNVGSDASFRFICGQANPGATIRSWMVFRNTTDRMEANFWSGGAFSFNMNSVSQYTDVINPGWHHIAVVRHGTSVLMFIDGILEGSTTSAAAVDDIAFAAAVGALGQASGTWQGWIDEFRFSVGVARWTANFIPPPAPFTNSDNTLGVVRAQFGTTAIDHTAEDRVQLCLYYVGMSPADIISDLLITYAGVDPAMVPLATWQNEVDTFLDRLYTKLIADPEGVQDLISRLIQQAGLAMWWDSVTQLIRLQVLRGVATDAFLYDQSNVLSGTISVSEQPDKRVTQVWTYYGVRNPTEPLDQPNNFRSGLVTVELEAELQNGGAVINVIYADWIPAFGQTTAQRVNDLQIGRFVTPPRKVAFSVMRGSGVLEPELGGGYRLNYWGAQTEYGSEAQIPLQITRLTPMADQIRVEGEEMLFTQQSAADLINRVILFDSDSINVNLRSVHDSIYPVLTAQDVIDGVTLVVTVGVGVTIGSSGTAASFDVSSGWPVGMPILIQNRGVIAGKGGDGGRGHTQTGPFGGIPATAGTLAFLTTFPISLDNLGGVIGGGAGGGGSGGSHNFGNDDDFPGGGGGGGAGAPPGAGGLRGALDQSFNTDGEPGTLLLGGLGGDGFGFGTQNDGGNGGNLGAAGSPGDGNVGAPQGAAGVAINGISHITVINAGTVSGAQIN